MGRKTGPASLTASRPGPLRNAPGIAERAPPPVAEVLEGSIRARRQDAGPGVVTRRRPGKGARELPCLLRKA
eukprot:11173758-Lingulodinium_polyedra.AAC.1